MCPLCNVDLSPSVQMATEGGHIPGCLFKLFVFLNKDTLLAS